MLPRVVFSTSGRRLPAMKLARGLERRLEQLVDGIASRIFRGQLHPVELGARLVREADLASADGPAGTVVPNRFVLVVPGDTPDEQSVTRLQRVLATVVEDTAIERGWRLSGPVEVTLEFDDKPGAQLTVETGDVSGELAPWARLVPSSGGRAIELTLNRNLVGRSADSDVHIGELGVSRRHAIVYRETGRSWVADQRSSNGTRVNGRLIVAATPLDDGDVIAFGPAQFIFRESV